ncbi:MAG: hypothetical protein PVF69_12675 [Gemmatimonadota bacterium]
MGRDQRPWFARHPALALLGVNLTVLLLVGGAAELGLRHFVRYNPGFYTSVQVTDTELRHPYGVIKINSDGFPDDEFDLSKPLRVGYFGDSVTYGVGAGYPYRISEYLEEAYPEYEHLNLGGIGLSVSSAEIENSAVLARRFGLTDAIYLFNLNDILPDQAFSGEIRPASLRLRDSIVNYLDWMRGRSYLYTFIREKAKAFLAARGVGFHGYTAYEFEPTANEQVLRETAERINAFHRRLAELGVRLTVVILPYEMQISSAAAEAYAAHGIHWEDGFLDGSAQRVMMRHLAPDVPVIDAFHAFVGDGAEIAKRRARNGLGEYFVYDKGDKLDWNHPNRKGHRAIARYLAEQHILNAGLSSQLETARVHAE